MPRQSIAVIVATLTLVLAGCRQTTGPTGTAVAPVNSLTPVTTGQAPVLGPFGGPTRVTPPATGSYVAPNNYLGGVAPVPQAQRGPNTAAGLASQNDVIGSGVQVAGWTETGSTVAPPTVAPPVTAGINSSNNRDPRSGGMRIIDLTGAPAPPGYRGTAPSFPTTTPGTFAPQTQLPNVPAPSLPAGNPQSFGGGVQTINIPTPGQIAGQSPPPLQGVSPSAAPIGSFAPRTAAAPVPGPSTEPINPQGSGSATNLPWRRPGSNF